MDYDGGLPYDESDAAAAAAAAASAPAPAVPVEADDDGDLPMLDRPLDDFPLGDDNNRGSRREPMSASANDLMKRMGRGKVYMADESPGIFFNDGEQRISKDPRLSKLAKELDSQDPVPWLDAISDTAPSRIRPLALFVESELVKHLSTAKVLTWASGVGASVMGVEWLNDSTFILLFPTPAAALLNLSMLAKAGFDPTEGDDPLMERAAHPFPAELLPRADPEPSYRSREARVDSHQSQEDDDVPRVRGRGAVRATESGQYDLPRLDPTAHEEKFATGIDPNARVTVRYAVESDNERRRDASESKWYEKHGRRAGKEKGRPIEVRYRGERKEPINLRDGGWNSNPEGGGLDFARRIGRERRGPYDRPPPRRRANAEDLDAELERLAEGRANGDEFDVRRDRSRSPRRGGRGRRDGRDGRDGRGRARQEDLDKELDDLHAARSAA